MLQLCSSSLADTHAIAAAVAAVARPGDMIVLAGDMGSGKTAFAQGFGRALGVTEPITSPTFTLVHSYECGKLTLHHADLYRLERTTEVVDLALAELAEFDGIVLVEWGDVVENSFGDHLVVHLAWHDESLARDGDGSLDDPGDDGRPLLQRDGGDDLDDGRRLLELSATGSTWAERWDRITSACERYQC